MKIKRLMTLFMFNIFLVVLNIVIFSRAFLGIEISQESPIQTAFVVAFMFTEIGLFIAVNIKLMSPNKKKEVTIIKEKDIGTLSECEDAVKIYLKDNINTFKADLEIILRQIERFTRKKITTREILKDKFSEGEISFEKFISAIDSIELILIMNIKSVIRKISVFDEEEFEEIIKERKLNTREKTATTRRQIYNEYISFIQKVLQDNEDVILKVDRLIMEVTKLSSIDYNDIETLNAIKNIEELIKDTRLYK